MHDAIRSKWSLVFVLGVSACGPATLGNWQTDASADGGASDAIAPCTTCNEASADVWTTPDDFANPIIDTGAPQNAPDLFAPTGQATGGPCMFEPQVGSLFPMNWLRLRFRYTPQNGDNLFEIKLVVPKEPSPLRIYTTNLAYTLSANVWTKIASIGGKVHMTIRSGVYSNGVLTSGPSLGSEGDFEIAPVSATGSIVYWTTSNGTMLKGFQLGDETVHSVLTPAQAGASSGCVGCHMSTPDGTYVATSLSQTYSNGYPSYVEVVSLDGKATPPPFLTPSATTLLQRNSGQGQVGPATSKGHWTTGDHTLLTQLWTGSKYEIAWTDLEATSTAQNTGWGIIARNGDTRGVEMPVWSHDGTTIVYSSVPSSGGTDAWSGSLWSVPYANRAGGTATQLAGGDATKYHDYYPAFSADDKLLTFNRVAAGQDEYNDSAAEVFVMPSSGGTPTRLAANDPPACQGVTSPGVTNSWPRWSSQVTTLGGNSYYFIVFSSTRDPLAKGGQQIYVAPIVVDSSQNVTTYPALYMWNQPEDEHNHTPAWDGFTILPN
jgi:hypothetical protein